MMRALLPALLLIGAAPAETQQFPPLSGRVVDAADILPPAEEARIAARSAAIEQASGTQIVVATIPDLGHYDIADYGYRLGRAWGVGQKDRDNGVLLIVAPKERRVRIEVGYGLEPVLTDALAAVIIQRAILPRFRAGDLPGGVEAGFNAIAAQFELAPDQAAANVRAASTPADEGDSPGIGGGFLMLLGGLLLFRLLRSSGSRRRHRGFPLIWWGSGGGWGGRGGGGGGGGGFSGGGGSFGGGGASGGW